ncbi:hypothetical protein [Variovorax sp. HJSM1_2]|uniref:hypothetical protein n=1 Tax=Variovorax sp. HJSM1_2 TaxID=3366263 RepID=UPI003BD1E3E9
MLLPPHQLLRAIPGIWLVLATSTQALETPAPEVQPPPSCVDVEVDGVRAAPSYACLNQRLNHGLTPPAAKPSTAERTSDAITQRPTHQLGVFNRAATGHRMGNTFGTSVYPQRPVGTTPSTPILPSRPSSP